MRSCFVLAPRPARRSSSSSVLRPSLCSPASRSCGATQLRIDTADGSYSRATPAWRPSRLTNSTICRRTQVGWLDALSPRRSLFSCPLSMWPTKAGQRVPEDRALGGLPTQRCRTGIGGLCEDVQHAGKTL